MRFARLLVPITVFLLIVPQGLYADEAILASPVFELPAGVKDIKAAGKRIRDDESIECSARFPKADPPTCLDESDNPIVEYPLTRTCRKNTILTLLEAGECENPCRCQDLRGDGDRKSVVSCHHPQTQWACAPREKAEN